MNSQTEKRLNEAVLFFTQTSQDTLNTTSSLNFLGTLATSTDTCGKHRNKIIQHVSLHLHATPQIQTESSSAVHSHACSHHHCIPETQTLMNQHLLHRHSYPAILDRWNWASAQWVTVP